MWLYDTRHSDTLRPGPPPRPVRHFPALIGTVRRLAIATAAVTAIAGLAGCGGGGQHQADPYHIGSVPNPTTIAQDHQTGHWQHSKQTLSFDGVIGASTPGAFKHLVTPKTTTVEVSSPGGDLVDALPVAQYIKAHRMTVVVTGACVGPCADYWFTAAHIRRTQAGGWVGFSPDLSMAGGRPAGDPVATVSSVGTSALTAAVKRETALYTDTGLDVAKLRGALTQLPQASGGAAAPEVWMPTRAELRGIGLGVPAGDWLPANLAAANAHARAWGVSASFDDTLVGTPGKAAPVAPVRQASPSAQQAAKQSPHHARSH